VTLIGLSGGIGSGKSTVARMLAAKGAVVIDADRVAHEILARGGAALPAVVERFGPGVLGPDGGVDRAALRAVVAADPQARRDLEAISHPLIYTEIVRQVGEAALGAVVVIDAALLVETLGRRRLGLQALVVVAADEARQIERAVRRSGMTAEEAAALMAAQAPAERKLAAADYVIDNRGGLEDLAAGVDTLWRELSARFGASSGAGAADPR